jgi:pimeloyl-ACP methyl ester carboxylesterase
MSFEDSFITVNGCRTHLRRSGRGEPMLYLHGAAGAAAIAPFMETLAADHDLIVPEHPGFGLSDEPPWLENIHDLAYFYLDLLDQLALPSVHLVGSSLGGWLAMEMAVRQPGRFRSLVLVGAAGIRVPDAQTGDIFLWSAEQAARNIYFDQALAEKMLAMPTTPEQQDILLKNRHTMALLAWQPRLHDPFLHKWLHRLDMPVKLMWGAQDKVIPPAFGHALKALIPRAELQLFDQCGHLPQVEWPREFCASVKQFVQQVRKP